MALSADRIPKTILLLGTDASGKNHVASVWATYCAELGVELEIREGWVSAPPVQPGPDEEKGRLSLLAEQTFITLFPVARLLLPLVLPLLLKRDLRNYRHPGKHLLIVSHKVLRILAFWLGQDKKFARERRVPPAFVKVLKALKATIGGMVLVLDIEDSIRQARIRKRCQRAVVDPFDRFMAADSERSERIEDCLVFLAREHLGAHLIENNDLEDQQLREALEGACP